MVHGGLRYLEHYEFRLVRESLQEREVMLKSRRTWFPCRVHRAARRINTPGMDGAILNLLMYDTLAGAFACPFAHDPLSLTRNTVLASNRYSPARLLLFRHTRR